MSAAAQMDALRTARMLYCWWCEREITSRDALVTDALGRPLHAGACSALSAEFDGHEDDDALAARIETEGQHVGDEHNYGGSTANVYDRLEAVIGCPTAIVWRRSDGAAEITRYACAVHALLDLDAQRRDRQED